MNEIHLKQSENYIIYILSYLYLNLTKDNWGKAGIKVQSATIGYILYKQE